MKTEMAVEVKVVTPFRSNVRRAIAWNFVRNEAKQAKVPAKWEELALAA